MAADSTPKDWNVIYGDLRRIAASLLGRDQPAITLQPTALVNEAVLRLLKGEGGLKGYTKEHLVRRVRKAMRHILTDRHRQRVAVKHGGGRRREASEVLDTVLDNFADQQIDAFALYDALEVFAAQNGGANERAARVVELHYFYGYSQPEVAELLDVALSTVESDLRYARSCLQRLMSCGGDEGRGHGERS